MLIPYLATEYLVKKVLNFSTEDYENYKLQQKLEILQKQREEKLKRILND